LIHPWLGQKHKLRPPATYPNKFSFSNINKTLKVAGGLSLCF